MSDDNVIHEGGRRAFLTAAGAAGASVMAGCSGSTGPATGDNSGSNRNVDFPNDDLHLIIPHGPGGGYDEYARTVAPYLLENLPNEVDIQIQNVDGAGGRIAAEQVYNEDPDGHTLLIVNAANFSITQLSQDVNYDMRDYTYYSRIARDFWTIAVGTNTDIHTWADFVEATKNEEVRFAATSLTNPEILTPLVTGMLSGLYPAENVTNSFVQYDGKGESLQGIMSGDVEAMCSTYSSIRGFIESGDLRLILAITLEENPPSVANNDRAETLSTAEVPNREGIQQALVHGRLFAGPPGVSDEQTAILRDAFREAIHDEEFRAEMDEIDRPIVYADGETAAREASNMIGHWQDRDELIDFLRQHAN